MKKLKNKYFTPKRASESAWSIVQTGENKKDCIYFCTKHCTAGLSISRPGGIKRNITATIMAQPVQYHTKHKNNQFTILAIGEQKRGATAYNIEIENSHNITTLFKQYILEELSLRGTPYTQSHARGIVAAPFAPQGLILQTCPQVSPQTAAVTASRTLQTALYVLGEDSSAFSAARPPTKHPAGPMAPQGHNNTPCTVQASRSEAIQHIPHTVQASRGIADQQTDKQTDNNEGTVFITPFSLWRYSPPTNALFSQPKKGKERKEEEYKQTILGITNEPQLIVEEVNARDTGREKTTTTHQHNKNEGG